MTAYDPWSPEAYARHEGDVPPYPEPELEEEERPECEACRDAAAATELRPWLCRECRDRHDEELERWYEDRDRIEEERAEGVDTLHTLW